LSAHHLLHPAATPGGRAAAATPGGRAASSTTSAEPWPAPTATRNEPSHSPSCSLLRSHILPQPQ
jgi:hypothetical protein